MRTAQPPAIVLVHGAWGGAWVWRKVLPLLRAAGHEVHAVTLTGDGERAHLRRPDTGLPEHIADVVGLVRAEELSRVLLVGHSYGGMVITGAADTLMRHTDPTPAGQPPCTVAGLVYVDAMVPLPGEMWSSQHSEEVRSKRLAVAALNHNALLPPDASGFGLTAEDSAWLQRRHVPHPFAPYTQPIQYDATRWQALPRTFIDCNAPAYPTIEPMRRRVRQQPGWTVVEMATGHFPMVGEPEALAQHLLKAAAQAA